MFSSQETEEMKPEQRRGDTTKEQSRTTQKHTLKSQREKSLQVKGKQDSCLEDRHLKSCVVHKGRRLGQAALCQ